MRAAMTGTLHTILEKPPEEKLSALAENQDFFTIYFLILKNI